MGGQYQRFGDVVVESTADRYFDGVLDSCGMNRVKPLCAPEIKQGKLQVDDKKPLTSTDHSHYRAIQVKLQF